MINDPVDPLADTDPCPPPVLSDPEDGFQIGYPIRRATFLPEPLYDLSAEELDEP